MKKIGIIAIIIGAILLILGVGGMILLAESNVSGAMLDGSLAMYDIMGMTESLGFWQRLILNIIRHRILLTVFGFILIIAGIVILVSQKSNRNAHPEQGRSGQQGYTPYAQQRTDSPSQRSPARLRGPVQASSRQSSQTLLPFSEDRCCVCNRSLADGHAVLFSNEYGAEARIDSICYEAIHVLGNSDDEQEVHKALSYIKSRLRNVDPIVAKQLQKYIQSGEDFLYQSEEEY